MANRERFEQPGDELDDDEYPGESFGEDSGDEMTETLPCPECGTEIYEDAPRCPACGAYVTSDTRGWSGRPAWWIILGLAGVAAAILVLTLTNSF
jgi:hypothetical protein